MDIQRRRIVTLQSAVKMFIALYHIMQIMKVFIRLHFDQINFSPQNCHSSYSFKLHFNIILPPTYVQIHRLLLCIFSAIYEKLLSSVKGHTFQCTFLTSINQKTVSEIMRMYNYMLYVIFFT